MAANNKPLAIISASRLVGLARWELHETLFFTSDKVIVVRTATAARVEQAADNAVKSYLNAKPKGENTPTFNAEEMLKTNEKNFAIVYSQVEVVEPQKGAAHNPA